VADFEHAGIADGVRFTAQVGLPNVLQGLFRKRELPTRVAGLARAELQGYLLMRGLVDRHGPAPFWVRVGAEEVLLVHRPEDLEFVLDGSPDPFASDPDKKRNGMSAFQPDALTLSRGDVWRARRTFAEAVLETGSPLHRLAGRFLAIAAEEATALADQGSFDVGALTAGFQRVTRRVVFGDAAADDTAIHEQLGALMAAGNTGRGKPAKGYDAFLAHLQEYVDSPDPEALSGLFAALAGGVEPAGQVVHWLFAMGDTLPANLMRAFALLATHPEQLREVRAELSGADLTTPAGVGGLAYLGGCILEAMRLWPTTPLFARVTTREVTFPDGGTLPEGTQVMIYNVFNHRNKELVLFADRFAPGEWSTGDAASNWSFNFFSNGPQGCPGAGLSVFLGQAFLATVLAAHDPELDGARLDPGSPLPHGLDVFGLKITLAPRD
jgi:cytochrome P450